MNLVVNTLIFTKHKLVMKKFTILIAVILISIGASNAQTPITPIGGSPLEPVRANRLYIGGVLNIASEKEKHEDSSGSIDGPTNTTLNVTPNVGYFVNDKFSVGLGAGYKYESTKSTVFDNQSNEIELKDSEGLFVVRPKASYYKKLGDNFYCFATYYLSFGFGTAKDQDYNFSQDEVVTTEHKLSTFKTGIQVGGDYFFNDHWAMMAKVGTIAYKSATQTSKEDSDIKWKESGFGLDFNFRSFNLGVSYYF